MINSLGLQNNLPVPPTAAPTQSHGHTALLHLALVAKDTGNAWADMALHQISLLSGIDYAFERVVNSGSANHKIVVL